MRVIVFGQGYVGLPLSIIAAHNDFNVIGVDADQLKVLQINSGISPIEDISNDQLSVLLKSGKYKVTDSAQFDKDVAIICICVPTPLSDDHRPDLKHLMQAVTSVGKSLKSGMLVIIESTIAPGTTRDLIIPALEKESGLAVDQFLVAYSPERIDPLNKNWGIKNTPKLVAGFTKEAADRAYRFYATFIDQVDICNSLEVAETAKLLENSFRLVNISFINELAIFCQKIGININDVIKAAATKPYGFMPFHPSVGVGGHCIPVDPIYLANAARQAGVASRFIELADEVNQAMPAHFVQRAKEMIGELLGKKILVIGLSYKPNVADVRSTPVAPLITQLTQQGAKVFWHDELVKSWNTQLSTSLSDDYDLAILTTCHDYLDLSIFVKTPILDTRGSI